MADEKIEQTQDAVEETAELSELEQLTQKLDELNDRLLRTTAEYANFRNRAQRERDAIYPEATVHAVQALLPTLDNFERAMATACADEAFFHGMQMILNQWLEALKTLGVEPIDPKGEAFDPNWHNAVMHVEDADAPENTVVEVFQKGYRLGDRAVRVAMVKVAN